MIEKNEVEVKFYEKLLLRLIMQGQIPKHIAFIMDGNRRYAKKVNLCKK